MVVILNELSWLITTEVPQVETRKLRIFSQGNPPVVRSNLNTWESRSSAAVRPSTDLWFPNYPNEYSQGTYTHSHHMSINHVNVCVNSLYWMKESAATLFSIQMWTYEKKVISQASFRTFWIESMKCEFTKVQTFQTLNTKLCTETPRALDSF